MALDLQSVNTFERSVQVEFPDPKKPGRTNCHQLRVRFNYLDADEYKEVFGFNEKGKVNHTQKEICDRIVDWVNPDDILGAESGDVAKQACIAMVAIQNAFINDYSDCISGFSRKNSK